MRATTYPCQLTSPFTETAFQDGHARDQTCRHNKRATTVAARAAAPVNRTRGQAGRRQDPARRRSKVAATERKRSSRTSNLAREMPSPRTPKAAAAVAHKATDAPGAAATRKRGLAPRDQANNQPGMSKTAAVTAIQITKDVPRSCDRRSPNSVGCPALVQLTDVGHGPRPLAYDYNSFGSTAS